MASARYVVIDLETSGVNPMRHDPLAIAMVPLDESLPTLSVYVRPTSIEWTPFALSNFAGFQHEWEQHAVSPAQACARIEAYLAETFGPGAVTAIGHNVGFDIAFLRRLAFLAGQDQIRGLSHRMIDTHTLLRVLAMKERIPERAVTSDGAFEHFHIDFASGTRHTALGDALATRELFRRAFDLV